MNKKILTSLIFIGLLSLGLGWGTYSYFFDVEESGPNVFTAGTIDIEVYPESEWSKGFALEDMKPCETGYIVFDIENVGTNPVNVFKHLEVTDFGQGEQPEPEIEEETAYPERAEWTIDDWITYDLKVEVYNEYDELIWWQVIIHQDWDVKVNDIACEDIPLGMIPVDGYMKVTQSYHLQAEVTNWAQGDWMEFVITIYGEQLGGGEMPGLLLVPKDQAGPTGETGEWIVLWEDGVFDGIYGELMYNTKGPTFDYVFDGVAPLGETKYCLIYYADPWPGDNPGALIACDTTDSDGYIHLEGSIDLGMDLPDPGDANYPDGAKIWLVTSSDYNNDAQTTGPMTAWHPDDYLFEYFLIKYDDTDV